MLNYKELNPQSEQAVILIHGLGASLDMWEFQFDALSQAGYRVIAPDMRGFGNSPEGLNKITIESMAQDVQNLMHKLHIDKANIIGLSMGGAIAQSFALQFPEKLQKLILANTAARFANKIFGLKYIAMRYIMLKLMPREKGAKGIAKFVFPKKNQEEFRQQFVNQILMASDKAYFQATKSCINHDLRKQVGNIKAPTLLIGGKEDLVTMPFLLRHLNALIPHSELIMLDGGHVTAVDSAESFNNEILAFLGKKH